MPNASAHPCAQPGCPTLVRGQARCAAHTTTQAWRTDHTPVRIRGRKLQQMRERLFRRQPLCVQCLAEGQETIATIRDHIIPLAEGGHDNETNEQALCQTCSDVKTKRESARGGARWR